jgi:hypothetical protein
MDSKYKSDTAKNGSVFLFVYKSKIMFLATYWVSIIVLIILIYPSEIEVLKNYFPKLVNLSVEWLRLIKIGFSIFATLLAIILNWYESKLRKLSSYFLILGLIWSILLAIDSVYSTGYLQRVFVYLIKSLAICSIFQGITGLNIVLPVTGQSNIASVLAESNKGEDTKNRGTRKPEEINTELTSRNRSRMIKKAEEKAEGLSRHVSQKKKNGGIQ